MLKQELRQEIEKIRLAYLQLCEQVGTGSGGTLPKYEVPDIAPHKKIHFELLFCELLALVKENSTIFDKFGEIYKTTVQNLSDNIYLSCSIDFRKKTISQIFKNQTSTDVEV